MLHTLLLSATLLAAAEPPPAAGSGSAPVVAGPQLGAGGLHRFLFGGDYRDLWTAPVEIPTLDLATFAGGLEPVRRVGGLQTHGLALKGKDGKAYTFRGVLKDPSGILAPELRDSYAAEVLRDQVASSHPGSAVVASVIVEAAGILHSDPVLVVMPDDPALGEFRSAFAGLLGTIEIYPRTGFAGATEVIGAEDLYKRLSQGGDEKIDARAYLRARLTDIFLGDWDRHRGQWRWARVPGRDGYQPIPEDRDQAFVRFEGLALGLARQSHPQLVKFGEHYPPMDGIAWNGREQDRRFLAPLELAEYEAMATDLSARFSDAVLEDAVSRLPEAWRGAAAAELVRTLQARRARLGKVARKFFHHLSRQADVTLSDQPEQVEVEHGPGELHVVVREASAAEPSFERRFRRGETDEVRIYLGAGDDRVVVRGKRSGVRLRVIAGGGSDALDDRAAGHTRFYDDSGSASVERGPGTHVSRKPYRTPPPDPDAPWIPPRDWGGETQLLPWLSVAPGLGLFVGLTRRHTNWGFRDDPYSRRDDLSIGWATAAAQGRLRYEGSFHPENSRVGIGVDLLLSGVELLNFYGFGNETEPQGDDEFHRAEQRLVRFRPSLELEPSSHVRFRLGPAVEFRKTSLDDSPFLATVEPYGAGDFGQVGAHAGIRLDTRSSGKAAPAGLALTAGGSFFPAMWDVESSYGELHGEVEGRVGETSWIGLALRAGGQHVWGDYPFHAAAYLGGSSTVRGFVSQRFAGDSAVWGGAELRLRVGSFAFPVPIDYGVMGVVDSGRVFLEGESSESWHTGVGGGLWFSPVSRANSLEITVVRSEERTGFYLGASLTF